MAGVLDIASLRLDYARARLEPEDVDPSPIAQLEKWLAEAIAAESAEPTAMTLATASKSGEPNARIVLLKGIDARGLTFFTNYDSTKGRELAENPRAVLVAFWRELERQARVGGDVTRVSREESEAYFRSRPEGSQLGAWASAQSSVIADRAVLEANFKEIRARFAGGVVPLPPFWGGYRLEPRWVELWQGRPSRLHDRVRYTRIDGGWRIERLSP